MKNDKILIHFNTNEVSIYKLSNDLTLIKNQQLFFNETLVNYELLKKIDKTLIELDSLVGTIDNKRVRIYATGVFQDFSSEEKQQLVIHVYVTFGLYFNIIKPDLEQFYLKKSLEVGKKENLVNGLVRQEFRTVVICGSFQQNMKEISNIIDCLNQHNITVLSPWTKNIVQETIGTDFILLEGQELINERDAWRHKYDHMNKFIKADAIIVCNPNGIIGKGTMFEFGFMIAHFKRIIFTEEPKGLSILFPYEVGLNYKNLN